MIVRVYYYIRMNSSSVDMVIPKGSGSWMMADCRTMNQDIEQGLIPMPRLEEIGMLLGGAAAFCTLEMIQGYICKCLCSTSLRRFSSWSPPAIYGDSGATRCSQRQPIPPVDYAGGADPLTRVEVFGLGS